MAKITKLLEIGVKLHPPPVPLPNPASRVAGLGEGLAGREGHPGEGESGANFRALLSFVS